MNWRLAGKTAAEWRALEAENEALRGALLTVRGQVALLKEEVELLDGIISAGSAETGRCRTLSECVRVCHRLHVAEARLALPTRDEVLAELKADAAGEAS